MYLFLNISWIDRSYVPYLSSSIISYKSLSESLSKILLSDALSGLECFSITKDGYSFGNSVGRNPELAPVLLNQDFF